MQTALELKKDKELRAQQELAQTKKLNCEEETCGQHLDESAKLIERRARRGAGRGARAAGLCGPRQAADGAG